MTTTSWIGIAVLLTAILLGVIAILRSKNRRSK
ncbi:hypothetical protein SAMN04489731_13518 [Amycolatopsis regifaucium]|nr:hypothetical protein SAMN04489731_13518 [Amycolatopsis regifaucium]